MSNNANAPASWEDEADEVTAQTQNLNLQGGAPQQPRQQQQQPSFRPNFNAPPSSPARSHSSPANPGAVPRSNSTVAAATKADTTKPKPADIRATRAGLGSRDTVATKAIRAVDQEGTRGIKVAITKVEDIKGTKVVEPGFRVAISNKGSNKGSNGSHSNSSRDSRISSRRR